MSVNQQENTTKLRSNKTLSTSKSKKTLLNEINSRFSSIKKILIWLINEINNFLSKCSMVTHFTIILIPISIIFIFLIFFIHIKFYDTLFRFNYYKGVKEEFLDLYITEIDDMHSEIEAFLIKESYLDMENIKFFDIYFRELVSIGLLDDPIEKIFPDIHYEADKMYKELDDFYIYLELKLRYSVPEEEAKEYIDERNDKLKEFAKIYFYLLPVINYGIYYTTVNIDQTFLIAYEYDNDRNIIGDELYFAFPRGNTEQSTKHNFLRTHGLLNPNVSINKYEHSELINGSYYKENFFQKQDSDFRYASSFNEEFWSNITFNHLNYEINGNITKSLLMTLQLNINRNKNGENRHFIINIIYVLEQKEISDDQIDFSTFLLKKNAQVGEIRTAKYSDNNTFVVSQQEITEYSLSNLDKKYFHYGLYDNNYNFLKDGVSFDSFNLNTLSDPLNYYSSVKGFDYDLKYLSTLFLYAKMFQNLENSIYKKEEEEISINIFSDEVKVKDICSSINLSSYIDNIKNDRILNCWDTQNELYYGDDYKNSTIFDSYTSLPHCACLPLYCLDNYKTLKKEKYQFTEENYVSKINLPDRCQPIFNLYKNDSSTSQSNLTNWVHYLFNKDSKTPEKSYLKIKKENLEQMPDYYLLIFSEIKSNTETLFFQFFNISYKMEIMTILLISLLLTFIITIVIIYKNLNKYSLIIEEFTQKYEKFVYHSKCVDLMEHEDSKNNNNNKERKANDQIIQSETMPFLQNEDSLNELYNNDNYLIEDLFTIFCKYYNISQRQLEKYYSQKTHETKYQMKLKMMNEKNELFKLLCMFSIYAPFFRLNLSLEYKLYKYSKIIKKYDQYVAQVGNMDKEQTKLTKNILYELLSTENISDYGLVMNLNFKYISNINAENKQNSIQNALFKNVINKMKGKNEEFDNDININDIFFIIRDGDEKQNVKLILKKKNELMDLFRNKCESDNYLNFNKIESSFNFFLINSYYKYLKQISAEENNNK
jgi:hypothetical protein